MHLRECDTISDYQLTGSQEARVDQLLEESDSVRHFVTEGIQSVKGSDLTTSEILSAYFDYCSDRGWVAFSSKHVERELSDIMLELFRSARNTHVEPTTVSKGLSQRRVRGMNSQIVGTSIRHPRQFLAAADTRPRCGLLGAPPVGWDYPVERPWSICGFTMPDYPTNGAKRSWSTRQTLPLLKRTITRAGGCSASPMPPHTGTLIPASRARTRTHRYPTYGKHRWHRWRTAKIRRKPSASSDNLRE
jgi:hypothetical protein